MGTVLGSKDPGKKDQRVGDTVLEDRPQLKEPRKAAVILHNDDYTTMEFVLEVLHRFFKKTHAESMKIMLSVHLNGSGVAGIYPAEIAETKVAQVTQHAQENNFPLKVTAEPVD